MTAVTAMDQANAHPAVQGQTPVHQLTTGANELSVSVLDPNRSPAFMGSFIYTLTPKVQVQRPMLFIPD